MTGIFRESSKPKVYLKMGGGGSKSVETVKSENFEQSTLTEESFSIFNIHAILGRRSCPGAGGVGPGLLGLRPGPCEGQMAGGGKEGSDHT